MYNKASGKAFSFQTQSESPGAFHRASRYYCLPPQIIDIDDIAVQRRFGIGPATILIHIVFHLISFEILVLFGYRCLGEVSRRNEITLSMVLT